MSAQEMHVSAAVGVPTMMLPYHEELSASPENRSLFEMLARQKEKVLETDREWQDIKAQLVSACRQQDDVLKVNAVGGGRELVGNLDATEDQFSLSSWEFDDKGDEDTLPAEEAAAKHTRFLFEGAAKVGKEQRDNQPKPLRRTRYLFAVSPCP